MLVTPIPALPAPPKPGSADQLEQAFLEEMLKYCGPRTSEGAFGGGIGEDQFSSFLSREYAAVLAAQLDLGLATRMDLS
ncbi:hypothetical protein EYE42_15305 [Paracoccus subflavus]|uniref:Rod binding protein n=1 Tax=Paracoccus subflavus TaxID=2528244 RepID=A0A4V2JBS5_9RHOB|nr:rod-binding protein [Paracoccus subflavus]TBN36783.1 hypothetical protein EYE42_15305 [Paracoccus subflavus]